LASVRDPEQPGSGAAGMSYIRHVIQPGEKIIMIGRLSWILYHRTIFYVIVGGILVLLEHVYWDKDAIIYITVALFGALALVSGIHAWFLRWTTEIAVTDKRVIFKRGFVNRHTIEVNMDKVASVDVDQSILGRMFNFGTVTVQGTGLTFEPLRRVDSPLALRNAIIAK
jgi:uncharacterized membrane protein YdbT with pleckstrin-like domain